MTLPSGPGDMRPNLRLSLGLIAAVAAAVALPLALALEALLRPALAWWQTWLVVATLCFAALLAWEVWARRGKT